MEQIQDVLRRLDEYRKKALAGGGDTDVTVNEFRFQVGQHGKESVVNLGVDLTLTPKVNKDEPKAVTLARSPNQTTSGS